MSEFSIHWKASIKPRKQRNYRQNAPLHVSGSMIVSRLSKSISTRYKRRNIPVRKGDIVKVMRGKFKGKAGTIDSVDRVKKKVFIGGIEISKREGQKRMIPIDPSNIIITELFMEERMRPKIIGRKK